MRTSNETVKSQKAVVGEVEVEVFDSIEEARDFMGDVAALGLINSQHRTNKMNAIRAAANPAQTKKALMFEVMAQLTTEELSSIGGDPTKLQLLIDEKISALSALKASE